MEKKTFPSEFENNNIKYKLLKAYTRFALYKTDKGYNTTLNLEEINFPKHISESGRMTNTGYKYISFDRTKKYYLIRVGKKIYKKCDNLKDALEEREKVIKELGKKI